MRLADQATADLDIVLDRFSALLRISELEASVRHSGFSKIDLGELAARASELYEPLAEERAIKLTTVLQERVIIQGDDKLLFEALSNLLDNAVKFTPPGGRIEVEVSQNQLENQVEIRDSGPGVPIEEREAVLRRFHRGSNAHDLAGSGLGLSIVSAIMHLHGYSMELIEANPGLLVRIRMPAAAER